MKRVYLPVPMLHPTGEKLLRSEVQVVSGAELDEAGRASALAEAHGLCGIPVDADLMDRAPKLEVIGFPGSGYESVDVASATARGIAVVYAAGAQYSAVAEHALGLMLAVSKRIGYADRYLHREKRYIGWGGFVGEGWPGFPHEIGGKTVGLLGFGFIGRDLARKCRAAFDMDVLAYDPYFDPVEAARQGVQLFRRREELPALLARCDFVVLCLPLSDETRRIIGASELEAMRPDAVLINVSRGGTVDESALLAALESNAIGGAGIDVYDPEPAPDDHPFFGLENVVLTPHIGGWVVEAMPRLATTVAREMLAALRGERPVRLANPTVWDAPACRARQ